MLLALALAALDENFGRNETKRDFGSKKMSNFHFQMPKAILVNILRIISILVPVRLPNTPWGKP
jgi:hypothetical protein